MSKKLQSDGHSLVRYKRPNLDWRCGHECAGRRCPKGPSKQGQCRGGIQCYPLKSGDRWICTRLNSQGGPCENGPMPDGSCSGKLTACQPLRGIRSRRKVAVRVAILMSMAVVLFLLGSGFGKVNQSLIVPGPLTSNHSPSDISCHHCHSQYGEDSSLVGHGLDPSHRSSADRDLCLNCHGALGSWHDGSGALVGGGYEGYAHSLPPKKLQTVAAVQPRQEASGTLAKFENWIMTSSAVKAGREGNLGCSICHQEHHGREHDLRAITDQQCQVCHQERFHSLERGHPKAGDTFPYRRRTQLFFSHQLHFERFKSQNQAVNCASCHQPGQTMTESLSFEAHCASCHQYDIASGSAITVYELPEIDLEIIAEHLARKGVKLGFWPNGGELELPAITKLMLSSDPMAARAIEELEVAGVPLADLSNTSYGGELRSAASYVALRLKSYLSEALNTEQLKEDVLAAVGADLQQAEGIDLFPMLPKEALEQFDPARMAARTSGSNSLRSVSGLDNGGADAVPGDPGHTQESSYTFNGPALNSTDPESYFEVGPGFEATNGWSVQGPALLYQPTGHGDKFLRSWFELAALKPDHRLLQSLYMELAGATKCVRCHTADRVEGQPSKINWGDRKPGLSGFNKFDHRPHLEQKASSLVASAKPADQNQVCAVCHQLDKSPEQPYQDFFTAGGTSFGQDPHNFSSEFKPLSISKTCAKCHNRTDAGSNCTLCHNYHARLGNSE